MRDDLIKSAVSFLNDPQVANATLAKRVEFLESKGLTTDEVEEALRLANNPSSNASSNSSSAPPSYSSAPQVPPPLSLPPPIPKRDWKDYFVMATVSAGVAYGIYEVTRRYVLPLILPPTPSSLESDKAALEEEFARAEALLEQLQKDTEEIKNAELDRKEQFSTVLQEAQDAIETVKGQSQHIESDIKFIKTQVDTIKDSLPKALEKHRDQQDKALLDIQEELKSLKQLVTNRMKSPASSVAGPPPASAVPSFLPNKPTSVPTTSTPTATPTPTPPSVPVPPLPVSSPSASTPVIPKAGIPAWQLAASKSPEAEKSST